MGTSIDEESPIWIFGATTLEEEATGLVFGANLMANSLETMEKRKKKFELF